MPTHLSDLIDRLRACGIHAELHRPGQLVIRDSTGFGSPIWVTWHDDWHVCTWGPTCYRLPPSQDIELLCQDCLRAFPFTAAGSELPAEIVERYGLVRVEPDALHWLGEA